MSFEIGPLPPVQPGAAHAPAADLSGQLARASAPAGDLAVVSLSPSPPPEVLDEVAIASDRADELAAANRELHFRRDEATGRIIVQVRDLAGNVIRTIPPSGALAVMAGEPV